MAGRKPKSEDEKRTKRYQVYYSDEENEELIYRTKEFGFKLEVQFIRSISLKGNFHNSNFAETLSPLIDEVGKYGARLDDHWDRSRFYSALDNLKREIKRLQKPDPFHERLKKLAEELEKIEKNQKPKP